MINAPLAFGGMSKGGGWSAELGQFYAERTIAFNNVCGSVGKPDQDLSMPAVIVIGGVADGFKMLDAIPIQYEPGPKEWRGLVSRSAMGQRPQLWQCQRSGLPVPRRGDCDGRAAGRRPTAGPMKLKPMRIEDGWFGDRRTWETNYAAVAGYADYKGDKASAAWLPNRYVAYVWRSFVSRDPPVQVVAQRTDGRLKTPPFKPMDKRFLIVPHGTGVELAAKFVLGAEIRKVAFYDGDVRLGEAAVSPFQFSSSQVPAGPRAVFAKYTTADGKVGVSNPVLILAPESDAGGLLRQIRFQIG